jgi:hypothetical protein
MKGLRSNPNVMQCHSFSLRGEATFVDYVLKSPRYVLTAYRRFDTGHASCARHLAGRFRWSDVGQLQAGQ